MDISRAARDARARNLSVGVMYEEKGRGAFSGYEYFSLGEEGATSAARNLFSGFRELDRRGAQIILCQGFAEERMGRALMNRLRKAAGRRVRV